MSLSGDGDEAARRALRGEPDEESESLLDRFYRAMQVYAAEQESPMPWNGAEGWQVKANEIAQEFDGVRKECADSGLIWEKFLAASWREVMENQWGSDWRKLIRPSPSGTKRALQAAKEEAESGATLASRAAAVRKKFKEEGGGGVALLESRKKEAVVPPFRMATPRQGRRH